MANKAKFKTTLWSQPETLKLSHASIVASLDAITLPQWQKGETIAVVAMGASSHSAHTILTALTIAGFRGVNITASDLADAPSNFQPADHYLMVTESGRSPELIKAAQHFTVGRRIGITNFPDAAISKVIDFSVDLGGFADSRVYVVGYTATLMAYSLVLKRIGLASVAGDVGHIPTLVHQALSDFKDIAATIAQKIAGITSIDFVGHGFSYASAMESTLVFRESIRLPATGFDTFQYLHGPMQSGKKGTGLFVFGDGRELLMIKSQIEAGVEVILVTAASEHAIAEIVHPIPANLTVVRIPPGVNGFERAILEVVLVQLIADFRAESAGIVIEDYIYRQTDTKLPED